ncbi:MAG: hypothetical protein AAF292_10240 [Pseudomonadota bacterium]
MKYLLAGLAFASAIFFGAPEAASQTREKIFGISLGPGGVEQCPIGQNDRRRANGQRYFSPVWTRPTGWDTGPAIRDRVGATAVPYPCFVPHKYLGPTFYLIEATQYVPPPLNVPQDIGIFWPTSSAPALPGMRGHGSTKPIIRGIAINGSVETLIVVTNGLAVQDSLVSTLSNRFGEPTINTTTEIITPKGDRATSRSVFWRTPELEVELEGISEGLRYENEVFGEGRIYVRTLKGQRYRNEEDAKDARTNF